MTILDITCIIIIIVTIMKLWIATVTIVCFIIIVVIDFIMRIYVTHTHIYYYFFGHCHWYCCIVIDIVIDQYILSSSSSSSSSCCCCSSSSSSSSSPYHSCVPPTYTIYVWEILSIVKSWIRNGSGQREYTHHHSAFGPLIQYCHNLFRSCENAWDLPRLSDEGPDEGNIFCMMKFAASGLPTVMSWQGFQKSFSELATSLDCSTCDEQAPRQFNNLLILE